MSRGFLCSVDDLFPFLTSGLPFGGVGGGVALHFLGEGVADEGASGGKVGQVAEGDHLHDAVADGGGFGGSGVDGAGGCIGGHLIEQVVASAAANNPNAIEGAFAKYFEIVECFGI